jgi:hypothetical protein
MTGTPYGGDPPSQRHSRTSRAAAAQIKHRVGPLHQKLLNYLREHPRGASDEQLMDALNLGGNTERPRRRELQLMGYICDSGRRTITRSNRQAVMWVVSPPGELIKRPTAVAPIINGQAYLFPEVSE